MLVSKVSQAPELFLWLQVSQKFNANRLNINLLSGRSFIKNLRNVKWRYEQDNAKETSTYTSEQHLLFKCFPQVSFILSIAGLLSKINRACHGHRALGSTPTVLLVYHFHS